MIRCYRIGHGATKPHGLAIADVARALGEGALALIPTETVYGIGVAVDAARAAAQTPDQDAPRINGCPLPPASSGYRRIFSVKRRELTQTVPWLVADASALDAYGVDIDPGTRALAERLWPGALTLVVKAAPGVPAFMQAADGTVALRASASPVVQALVRACGCPLAVTSANTHGNPAPTSFEDVEASVLDGVDVCIDAGPTACRDASTIVSLTSGTPVVIRQGALSAQTIDRVLADAASAAGGTHSEKV